MRRKNPHPMLHYGKKWAVSNRNPLHQCKSVANSSPVKITRNADYAERGKGSAKRLSFPPIRSARSPPT
ncbi:hypothetical protein JTE90_022252 [Oedothorax gibbosus]|uniref:Uncharacterized protein n=1 Tax=Oedothorax gibbosus TaxID=931172 RepID=A0AAV6VX14_9ARAC|nr:hypothetical protein JTE90_022252 [Oedothorax gibbosus]